MQSGDILILFSELAVALAGFAGIVAALDNRKYGEWHTRRKLGFSTLLATSFAALFNCVLAMILLNAAIGENWVWKICSSTLIFSSIGINLLLWNRFVAGRPRDSIESVVYTVTIGFFVVLQIFNILLIKSAWPFLAGVTAALGSSAAAFVQLVITGPRSGNNGKAST